MLKKDNFCLSLTFSLSHLIIECVGCVLRRIQKQCGLDLTLIRSSTEDGKDDERRGRKEEEEDKSLEKTAGNGKGGKGGKGNGEGKGEGNRSIYRGLLLLSILMFF